ncbi:Hpt domain-containing protein [bacterium 1XD42-8]|nr:Hpt domain-containing protein [Lachnospiraceae bacterium]RKJ48061.1 Hpt domain-containing protein [bacterium 1XD42-8]
MTLKECYEEMEGDFEDVTSRLRTNERIQKFLLKVLDDKSFDLLLKSIEAEDWEEAFRAAHTLKGVCQNLAITRLYKSVSPLSDSLREGKRDSELLPMLKQVEKDYEHITKCIKRLEKEKE